MSIFHKNDIRRMFRDLKELVRNAYSPCENKPAFSLMEMLIVMLIVSLVMALHAPTAMKRKLAADRTTHELWSSLTDEGDLGFNLKGKPVSVIIGANTEITDPLLGTVEPPLIIRTVPTSNIKNLEPQIGFVSGLEEDDLTAMIRLNDGLSFGGNISTIGNGTVVIGHNYPEINDQSVVNVTNSVSIGSGSILNYGTSAHNSLALGHNVVLRAPNSIGIGFGNINDSAMNNLGYSANSGWVGPRVDEGATNSIVIGNAKALSGLKDSILIGSDISGIPSNSGVLAIGSNMVNSVLSNAIGIGVNAKSLMANTIAIGYNASANGMNAIALGNFANVNVTNSIAVGGSIAKAFANNSIAFGNAATANGNYSIALGHDANAKGANSIVIGASAGTRAYSSTPDSQIAIGDQANVTVNNGIAIGANAKTTYVNAYANALSIGSYANASNINSIAIGYSAKSSTLNSIAIGYNVKTPTSQAVVIGSNARQSDLGGNHIVVLGNNSVAASSGVAIGNTAGVGGYYGVALGNIAWATNNAVAVGMSAEVLSERGIAIGRYANVPLLANNAVAIGYSAEASGDDSVAVGADSSAGGDNSVVIGKGVTTSNANTIVIGNSSSDVHIPGLNVTSMAYNNKLIVDNLVVGTNLEAGTAYLGTNVTPTSSSPSSLYMYVTGLGWRYLKYDEEEISNEEPAQGGGGGSGDGEPDTDDDTTKAPRIKLVSVSSDARLKDIIGENLDGIDKVKRLKVYNYKYKNDAITPHVGVMAQQLRKIFPNAVSKDPNGFLQIRLEDMLYSMVNALKELDAKIKAVAMNLAENINIVKSNEAKIQARDVEIKELKEEIVLLRKAIEQLPQ